MLRNAVFLLLPVLFFVLVSYSTAQESAKALSPRLANYEMDVRLDVPQRLVHGQEILTWTNSTQRATSELQFHLYYNAWLNTESSMMRSIRSRNYKKNLSDYHENDWAYCKINSIQTLAGAGRTAADLTSQMAYIQPDDGNTQDRTVMRVTLPQPVGPGETIRVQINWVDKVPRTFERTGTRGDYFLLGQWFPKIGVLEENGVWNCHQFIQTEFFSDFGVYDVKLTVPTGWIVGATGKEIEKTVNDDATTTHHYYQEDVHDFVWVTTPYFHVFNDTFEEAGLPKVDMRLLLMPDHLDKKERYFSATRAALKHYGTWWGAYPYDHITVVDPAYGSGTGGMEYPTLFTGGTRWLSPPATRSPEGVTVHEAGHQFWYGIIANNEFEDAWMDEGFNTFSTTRTMQAAYPNPVLTRRYFEGFIPIVFPSVKVAERTDGADRYGGLKTILKMDRMSTKSWQYGPKTYGVNSYNKPAMMLRTLENYLGWETFQKVMSTYFDRWKFRHPKPADFFAVVNEVSGKDLTWFFDQTYQTSNIFDYGVGLVKSTPVRSPRGYYETGGALQYSAWEDENQVEADSSEQQNSLVYIRRWDEAVFPIDIKISFSDGNEVIENWDGKSRWVRFDYLRPAKVTRVQVDPENKLVLDVNHTNNTWTDKPKAAAAATKWASKWMIWLQNVLEFFALMS